jgi:multicomponent Na+:H+ antiporter subunit C
VTVSLTLLLVAGTLMACGFYLLMERTLTRVMLGYMLAGNGINLLFVIAIGVPGLPPFHGEAPVEDLSDPLPMAMVLTAIVITMALTAFVMALAYRNWNLFGDDEVPDDLEDRMVVRRAERDELRAEALRRHQTPPAEEEDPLADDLYSDTETGDELSEPDAGDDSKGRSHHLDARVQAVSTPRRARDRRRDVEDDLHADKGGRGTDA